MSLCRTHCRVEISGFPMITWKKKRLDFQIPLQGACCGALQYQCVHMHHHHRFPKYTLLKKNTQKAPKQELKHDVATKSYPLNMIISQSNPQAGFNTFNLVFQRKDPCGGTRNVFLIFAWSPFSWASLIKELWKQGWVLWPVILYCPWADMTAL